MRINCPKCRTKARIASSRQITNETREVYCQCLNLNCGATFFGLFSVEGVIRTPKQEIEPPSREIQPEFFKSENDAAMFGMMTK